MNSVPCSSPSYPSRPPPNRPATPKRPAIRENLLLRQAIEHRRWNSVEPITTSTALPSRLVPFENERVSLVLRKIEIITEKERIFHQYRQDHSVLVAKEVNGVLEGNALEFDTTGQLRFKYVNGKREGRALKRYYNTDSCCFSYSGDNIHGLATYESWNSARIKQLYHMGEPQGSPEVTIEGSPSDALSPLDLFQRAAIDLQCIFDSNRNFPLITKIVNITCLSGRIYTLHCNLNLYVKGLKTILAALENHSVKSVRLLYHEENLADNMSLKRLGIQDNDNFVLVSPLPAAALNGEIALGTPVGSPLPPQDESQNVSPPTRRSPRSEPQKTSSAIPSPRVPFEKERVSSVLRRKEIITQTTKRIIQWRQDNSLLTVKEINGVLSGLSREFDLTGELEFHCVNGKKEGAASKIYHSGNACRFAYKNDLIDGLATFEFSNRATISQYYEQGKPRNPPQVGVASANPANLDPYALFLKAARDLQSIVDSTKYEMITTKTISVKVPSGESYTFHCNVLMNVEDIKRRIVTVEHIPLDRQRILLNQQPLSDTTLLKDLKIKNNATFDVVVEP